MICLRNSHESAPKRARPVNGEATKDNKRYRFQTSKQSRARFSLIKNVLTWNGNSLDINMENVNSGCHRLRSQGHRYKDESENCSVMSDSLQHHGLCPWNSPGQNTRVRSPFPSPEMVICNCGVSPQLNYDASTTEASATPQRALELVWFSRYVPN